MDLTTIALVGGATIGILFIYNRFIKKKDALQEKILQEMQYDWGRKEVRKHTKEDLQKIAKMFPKYKKKLFIGIYDKKGTTTHRQELTIKTDDDKEKSKYKHYIYRYVKPLAGLDLPILNMLGGEEFIYVVQHEDNDKGDMLYENKKELHLREKEITQIFDVFMFVDEITKIKKAKIEEFVFKQGYEELTGRLNNEPAKVAQLDLQHTQHLAIEEKRAEVLKKMSESNNALKTM